MNLKAHRKILPAMLILLLSLALVSTATYAWFSMNTTVKGTGMSVSSTAPTNMLISVDAVNFENGVTANTAVAGGFSPASTVNGKTFFALAATDGIAVTGDTVRDGVGGNIGEVKLAQVDRVEASNVYYAEVALYVEAGEQTSLAEDLQMYLKRLTVSTSSATDIADCVRVSVTSAGRNTGAVTSFATNGTPMVGETPLVETDAKIYKNDTVTAVKPISGVTGNTPTLAAEDPALEPGNTTTCFTVDYTGQAYTTVIVRIWLEGQHGACINEIAGETITIGLEWEASNYSA